MKPARACSSECIYTYPQNPCSRTKIVWTRCRSSRRSGRRRTRWQYGDQQERRCRSVDHVPARSFRRGPSRPRREI